MIEPTCFIFSHKKDEHLAAVLSLFSESEFPFVIDVGDFGHSFAASANPANPRETTLRLQNGELVSISRLKSIWWRRPTGDVMDPATPEHLRSFVRIERTMFLDGLLASLPPEVRQYNDPCAHKRLNSKLYQLNLAAQIGFTIPDTCITSDPSAVKNFLQKHPQTIFKSFWGTAEFWRPTQMLTPEVQDKLDQVLVCPVIFQEFIEGDCDLRVTAIDDEIIAVGFDLTHSRYPADVRIDTRIPSQPCEIDSSVCDKIREFMRRSGVRYGAFDFRRRRDGSLVFFEINPGGQFLYLDHSAGTQIAVAMARVLSREVEKPADSVSPCQPMNDEKCWPEIPPIPLAAFGSEVKHLT